VYELCEKTSLEETFMRAPSFLVCAGFATCVRAHMRTPYREHSCMQLFFKMYFTLSNLHSVTHQP